MTAAGVVTGAVILPAIVVIVPAAIGLWEIYGITTRYVFLSYRNFPPMSLQAAKLASKR